MRQITIRDEDFVGGVCQLPEPLDELHVKVLIADTDNIDTSTTPDNTVLLKLPEIGSNNERGMRVRVDVLTDLSATLRIVGATPSQGVGHGALIVNVETTTRGDSLTFVASRDRAWEVVSFGNIVAGDGSFGGTFNSPDYLDDVAKPQVYLGATRVDENAGDDHALGIFVAGPTQLTSRVLNADSDSLNGVPVVFRNDSGGTGDADYGIHISTDGLITPSLPGANGDYANLAARLADQTNSTQRLVYAMSLGGFPASILAMIEKFIANGVRVRAYDDADVEIADSGVRSFCPSGDRAAIALAYRGDAETGTDFTHLRVRVKVTGPFTDEVASVRIEDGSGAFVREAAFAASLTADPLDVNIFFSDDAGVSTINTVS